jgi:3-deoxy-7-phosphoheptulonate synthase
MIITLKKGSHKTEIDRVIRKIKKLGYLPHVSRGVDMTIIGMIGEQAERHRESFESMDVVDHISEIEKPYKLASREFKKENSVVNVGGIKFGGKKIVVMAGPCGGK